MISDSFDSGPQARLERLRASISWLELVYLNDPVYGGVADEFIVRRLPRLLAEADRLVAEVVGVGA